MPTIVTRNKTYNLKRIIGVESNTWHEPVINSDGTKNKKELFPQRTITVVTKNGLEIDVWKGNNYELVEKQTMDAIYDAIQEVVMTPKPAKNRVIYLQVIANAKKEKSEKEAEARKQREKNPTPYKCG